MGRFARQLNRLNAQKLPPSNEADGRTFGLPAPIGGWNARGNIAAMAANDAIVMDNCFPGVQEVGLRKGSLAHATSIPSTVLSLLPYNAGATSKLFAATSAAFYDVTTAGAVGAAATTCTNGFWKSINFVTAGGTFLFAVNGVDKPKLYDGASWTNIDGVSVPAITGVTTSNLSDITAHKKRIWFVEKSSMKLWYLPVEAVGGAAVAFPVGSLFKQGGYIAAIGTWTLDAGAGVDDLFVIVTSEGEIAVYQGTDPSTAATWALVGVYNAGKPVGTQPLLNFGGDLLYLNKSGLYPLSKLLRSSTIDRSEAVSFKIDQAFLDAFSSYGGNSGWQMALHKAANLLIVNVPAANLSVSYQYVMNTTTKAWCRFTGWNAFCWAILGDGLYFGGSTVVDKAWVGANDKGGSITGSVAQAYSPLGSNQQKRVGMVRPIFQSDNAAMVRMSLDADFRSFPDYTELSYGNLGSSVWDTALWDSGVWASEEGNIEPRWHTVPANMGYLHSFRLQITSSTSTFEWVSTRFLFQTGGVL